MKTKDERREAALQALAEFKTHHIWELDKEELRNLSEYVSSAWGNYRDKVRTQIKPGERVKFKSSKHGGYIEGVLVRYMTKNAEVRVQREGGSSFPQVWRVGISLLERVV